MDLQIPDKCSLAQAALVVSKGVRPVDENLYDAASRRDIDVLPELIYALRSGELTARGTLRISSSELVMDLVGLTLATPLLRDAPIPPEFWMLDNIITDQSQLIIDKWVIELEYDDIALLLENIPGDEYMEKLSPCELLSIIDRCYRFTEITVPTSALFRLFPQNSQAAVPTSAKRLGRPPTYNWDQFFAEVIVRAELDRLPQTQAGLVDQMADWCIVTWGDQPSEAVLKEKTALIYRHPKKAGK